MDKPKESQQKPRYISVARNGPHQLLEDAKMLWPDLRSWADDLIDAGLLPDRFCSYVPSTETFIGYLPIDSGVQAAHFLAAARRRMFDALMLQAAYLLFKKHRCLKGFYCLYGRTSDTMYSALHPIEIGISFDTAASHRHWIGRDAAVNPMSSMLLSCPMVQLSSKIEHHPVVDKLYSHFIQCKDELYGVLAGTQHDSFEGRKLNKTTVELLAELDNAVRCTNSTSSDSEYVRAQICKSTSIANWIRFGGPYKVSLLESLFHFYRMRVSAKLLGDYKIYKKHEFVEQAKKFIDEEKDNQIAFSDFEPIREAPRYSKGYPLLGSEIRPIEPTILAFCRAWADTSGLQLLAEQITENITRFGSRSDAATRGATSRFSSTCDRLQTNLVFVSYYALPSSDNFDKKGDIGVNLVTAQDKETFFCRAHPTPEVPIKHVETTGFSWLAPPVIPADELYNKLMRINSF